MKAQKERLDLLPLWKCGTKGVIVCLLVGAIVATQDTRAYETFTGYYLDQDTGGSCHGSSGYLAGDTRLGQSFIPTGDSVGAVSFTFFYEPMEGTSGYSKSIIEIRPDNGGFPSDVVLGTASGASTDLPPLGRSAAVFDPPVPVTPGETYYIVVYRKPTVTDDIRPGLSNLNYPDGHAYHKDPGGEWVIGNPWGDGSDDYCFTQYWYGETVVPVAAAGEDLVADANETITLDASGSFDPDGTVMNYMWKTLPCRGTGPWASCDIIYSGAEPICEAKALGMVEEVIELTVTDNLGVKGVDTLSVLNKKVKNIELTPGPPGPQGEQGPPGVTPEEVAQMQARIAALEEQVAQLKKIVEENRRLLEQLPQLKKYFEELEAE